MVEIVSKDITITSPVKGPFVIEPRAVAKKVCVAKEVNLDNEIGDLEIENGNFNESK